MTTVDNRNSVRAFVRNLNVVIKQVNLYGLAHKQVAPQLENTWKELESALNLGKLVITGAGDHLLLSGKPLNAGSADRALAQLFSASGLAGLCFLPELSSEQFGNFVKLLAVSKSQDLLPEFKKQFGPKAAVRLLEFQISSDEPAEQGMNLAGHIAAAMLGTTPISGAANPASPADLLRLLCSVDANERRDVTKPNAPAVAGDLGEDEVTQTIRWLALLGKGPNENTEKPETPRFEDLPLTAQEALRTALNSPAAADLAPDQPALISLAEQLAVKVALEKYQRGDIQLNAVQQMLQRLKQEIAKLQGVVRAQEDSMYRAGISGESQAETLDQRFWAGVPAKNKLQVLLSPEGYCVPPKNVASFVAELLTRNDRATAEHILKNYCALLRSESDYEAKLKIARGIRSLADTYVEVSDRVLQWAMAVVASALSKNLYGELGDALSAALGELGRQTGVHQNYEVLRDYLDQLSGLHSLSAPIGERVWSETKLENCVARFVDDAVNALEPKPDLLDALKRMPGAVADELKTRAAACTRREDYRRLAVLSRELGTTVLDTLKRGAISDQPSKALLSAGLLLGSDALFVEEILKKRLPEWSPSEQSAAIHQIACSGTAERGVLLTQLFDCFDELILPQAIDEIGISGNADIEKLLEITGRRNQASPYIQLKVMEALGNLRAKDALPLLRHFVLSRSMFKFEHARETRIVAMQTILKIDPNSARDIFARSGLTSTDLQLAPLRPGPGDWVRQRRYARIPIDGSVWAAVKSPTGSCNLSLEAMSMGGGGGRTNARTNLAPEGMVEMQLGLRKLKARVLLHPIDTCRLGFEIASIPLEDRTRLRQFLTARQNKAN